MCGDRPQAISHQHSSGFIHYSTSYTGHVVTRAVITFSISPARFCNRQPHIQSYMYVSCAKGFIKLSKTSQVQVLPDGRRQRSGSCLQEGGKQAQLTPLQQHLCTRGHISGDTRYERTVKALHLANNCVHNTCRELHLRYHWPVTDENEIW